MMDVFRVSFIGHSYMESLRLANARLEALIHQLLLSHEYVEFYIGRNGDFDLFVPTVIKRLQRALGNENNCLILVLPYHVKDEEYYREYYDEIMMPISDKVHYKNAIAQRNRWMVDNSHLLVAYVDHPSGGAYQTVRYAQKRGIKIISIAKEQPDHAFFQM